MYENELKWLKEFYPQYVEMYEGLSIQENWDDFTGIIGAILCRLTGVHGATIDLWWDSDFRKSDTDNIDPREFAWWVNKTMAVITEHCQNYADNNLNSTSKVVQYAEAVCSMLNISSPVASMFESLDNLKAAFEEADYKDLKLRIGFFVELYKYPIFAITQLFWDYDGVCKIACIDSLYKESAEKDKDINNLTVEQLQGRCLHDIYHYYFDPDYFDDEDYLKYDIFTGDFDISKWIGSLDGLTNKVSCIKEDFSNLPQNIQYIMSDVYAGILSATQFILDYSLKRATNATKKEKEVRFNFNCDELESFNFITLQKNIDIFYTVVNKCK